MTKKNDNWLIGILIVVAVVVGTGIYKIPTSTQSIVAGGGNTGSTSSCSGLQKGQPSVTLFASYPDPTNNGKPTQVAVGVNAFSQGISAGTIPALSSTTSATAVTFINGTLPCGFGGTVFFGGSDGTSYYTIPVGYPALTTSGGSISISSMPKMATLAGATISNQTTFGTTMTGATKKGVTGGKIVSAGGNAGPFTMTLTTGAGQFGENGTAITVTYNGISIQNVYVTTSSGSALSQTSYALPAAANAVQTGYVSKTYLAPALTNWNTAYNFQINVQTSSAFATNEPVAVSINDQEIFLQGGVGTPTIVNPNTNADLGLGILSYSNANSVNSLQLDQVPIRICGPAAGNAGC